MYIYTCIYINMYIYTYTQIYMYPYICMYIYTHTCLPSQRCYEEEEIIPLGVPEQIRH